VPLETDGEDASNRATRRARTELIFYPQNRVRVVGTQLGVLAIASSSSGVCSRAVRTCADAEAESDVHVLMLRVKV